MKPPLWEYLDNVTGQHIASTLQTWREQQADAGVLAFVCEQESGAVALLQQATAAAGMPLAGAVVPGLIAGAHFLRKGMLLLAIDASAPTQMFPLPRAAGRTADSAVDALADFVESHTGGEEADTLLLLVDGMTPDVASLLDRLYMEIGDQVNFAGSNVGSETFLPVPCLFDNETFIQGAALAILLKRNPGPALAHHYRGSDALRVATDIAGNRIKTINGRLAFEVYQELMKTEYGIELDRENFYRHGVHFPFAFNRASGESLVRIPVAVEDDGSILCAGEIPENALLGIVRAIEPGNPETAREVGAVVRADGTAGVLVFYCAGRFMHLGEQDAAAELAALEETVSPMPLFGILSLGEIGNIQRQGYPQFCNATIVALPWN